MSHSLPISVRNVSKRYPLYQKPQDRLKQSLFRHFGKIYAREFWALRDISFEVRKGEALGVIGRNGSGKSTLLQIIAGTLPPSSGEVRVEGRVAALLELGSGFNPEFTGRENVYLNGSILGLTRREMEARFDEIAAFADIGPFIDQPVKLYSSGMFVRLAFAVQACVEPDVLIVDEALSVGDIFFQQKSFQYIRNLLRKGTTLLFVTHDTAAMQNLCHRAILLQEGVSIFAGLPEETVSRYFANYGRKAEVLPGKEEGAEEPPPTESQGQIALLRADTLAHNILTMARSQHGTGKMELLAASFLNEWGHHSMSVELLKTATIHLLLKAHQPIAAPTAGIHLYDRMNNLVFAAGTQQLRVPLAPLAAGEERLLTFKLEMAVQPGEYTFSLGCAQVSKESPDVGLIHNRHEGLGPLSVYTGQQTTRPFYGVARLPMEVQQWRLRSDS